MLGWPCLVNAKELSAFAGIPMDEPRLPGLTLGASPQLPSAAGIPSEGRVLGQATFPGAERPIAIAPDDNSFRNLHVIGPTGSGKTSLALNLICGDLAAGHGVVVLDPKGDLVSRTLERIPRGRLRDVILVDPTDEQRPVGVNLLASAADAPEVAADQVVALFKGLYSAFWGPRTDDILRATLLTLIRKPGMTLAEVLPLLSNESGVLRQRLIGDLDDHVLEGFWSWFESLSPGERAQAVGPLANKLRTFLLRKRLRNVIGQSESTFSLTDVLAEQKVLLVNLSRGTLGEDASRLLGSAILAQIWQAVQARAALPESERPAVFGYVDEFQDYVGIPTSFADLLAQTRSYKFGLALLHQGFFQLPNDLKQAVLTNARSRVAFQLGHTDAATLAKEFGPDVTPDDLGALGAFEAIAQVSAGSQVSRPVSIKTLPPPPVTSQAETVRAVSRQRYGRPVAEVEAELRARSERQPAGAIKRTRRAS
jgi:type IV secretory pathway TraG/TraD family ATPase VirD4